MLLSSNGQPHRHVFCSVHPLDTTVAELMAEELIIRGVAVSRISMALQGTNTREQALLLTENDPSMKLEQVALVTAPENMYRSLAVFPGVGYTNVSEFFCPLTVCCSSTWVTISLKILVEKHMCLMLTLT